MSDEPADKPKRWRNVMLIAAVILALYPLSIGPLAFLRGTEAFGDKAVEAIRPIYAPLRMIPGTWPLGYYERQCFELGRRVHRWGRPGT
jgi:hypothetical protein